MSNRIDEARRVALALLDDLENSTSTVEGILMRAMRLARLMRDSDAQQWIEYETRGYPEGDKFHFSTLGTCLKYAEAGGRITRSTSKYYPKSLPALEAQSQSLSANTRSFERVPSPPAIQDFLVKRATEEFINGQLTIQQKYQDAYNRNRALVASLKSSIHSYDRHLSGDRTR